MALKTPKLNLLRVQEEWQFADDSFNRFIDDADDKLVGITHVKSKGHWDIWEANHAYTVGDVVRITNGKSHQYYQCIGAGTSGATEPMNNVTGSVVISDGDVEWIVKSLSDESSNGAIKIWLSGERYLRGDVVLYGTCLYRCRVGHDSTNWTNDNSNWTEIFSSIRYWQFGVYYFVGDTVIYDNIIWKCLTAHIAEATFSTTEAVNWEPLTSGRILDWKPNTNYKLDDIVNYYNGYSYVLYRCLQDHTSDSTSFDTDRPTKWKLFHTPSATMENWIPNNYYEAGQVVLYNLNLYRCTTSHTAASDFENDQANWGIIFASLKEWIANVQYKVGTTVISHGNIYRCNTNHLSNDFDDATENTYWDSVSGGGAAIKEWEQDTNYNADDLVVYDGTLYKVDNDFTSGTTFDDSDMTPIMGEHMSDDDIDDLWI